MAQDRPGEGPGAREQASSADAGAVPEADAVPEPDVDVLRPEWLERWRRRIARNRPLEALYRTVVLVVGLSILGAGLVMLVFPGPGWAAIILGLVVLATEFRWAERLLEPVDRFVRWLARRALDPKARTQNLILLALFLILCGLVLWWYLARYGATLEPLPLL
jgi:uncharacterized protein (TIGR02611 family)